jgi:hypothetical protein
VTKSLSDFRRFFKESFSDKINNKFEQISREKILNIFEE